MQMRPSTQSDCHKVRLATLPKFDTPKIIRTSIGPKEIVEQNTICGVFLL